jgi:hypothetical protein
MTFMGKRLVISVLVFAVVASIGGLCWNRVHLSVNSVAIPITHDAYVWQHDWSPAVRNAVADQHSHFRRLVILAAEISLGDSSPKVTWVHPDYAVVAKNANEIGIAIRVGPVLGSAAYEPASGETRALCDTAIRSVTDAKSAGLSVAELQIDFDCAESKLAGYRQWVLLAKSVIAPTPVVITALPIWLKHRDFSDLAREAGGFVMQVHSLHQPSGPDAKLTICDPAEAERAVGQASKIGVPFRVALPTYSYMAAFSAEGKFLALSAEGLSVDWPAGAILRPMRSDPSQLAPLVAEWTAHPPANMTGIIWYRLPVQGDAMNWSAVTLKAVMAGRVPRANLVAEIEHSVPGLVDLFVKNTGEADAVDPFSIAAECDGGFVISEGINGFDRLEGADGSVIFSGSSAIAAVGGRRIAPGQRMQIGWLRFASDTEVRAHVVASHTPSP